MKKDKKKLKIVLDVDGVLANFYKAICILKKKPYESINYWGIDWINNSIKELDKNFWENIPVLNKPDEINFEFEAYLTSIPEDMLESRRKWLKKHNFPDKPVICTEDKAKYMVDNNIDILIDDKPSTIAQVWRAGKIGLRYIPSYYNEEVNSLHHIRHLGDVEKVLKILKESNYDTSR